MEAACLKRTQIHIPQSFLLTSCIAGSAFPLYPEPTEAQEYPAERRAALVEALRRQTELVIPGWRFWRSRTPWRW